MSEIESCITSFVDGRVRLRLILGGGEIRPLPGKGQQVLPSDLIRIVFQQQGPGTAVHRHAQYSRQ